MEIDKEYKYNCEQCKFRCNDEPRWILHINCEKHKTGKRKKRSDCNGPYKCEECKYETTVILSYKLHVLNEHKNQKEREEGFTYYCKICDVGSFTEQINKKHIESNKHKKKENENK
jgi:hypothetical protein